MFDANNVVSDEHHLLTDSRAVIPLHGAFYNNEVLKVEASRDGVVYDELQIEKDFFLSPGYVAEMARVGIGVHSYVVIVDEYNRVRMTYERTPDTVGTDIDLLTYVSNLTFDRLDPLAWLSIKGTASNNLRYRAPDQIEQSQLEIFNEGLGLIEDALRGREQGQIDNATQQQVTALEVRQSALEAEQATITVEFNGIKNEFDDIQQLFDFITQKMLYGGGSNVSSSGGYSYVGDTASSAHTVVHGLGSSFLDVSVWIKNDNNVFEYTPYAPTKIQDSNTVIVTTGTPTQVIVVVRDYESMLGAYSYQSIAPATTYTLIHSLNTGFPSVCVWEEDANGDWILSQATVTMLSLNSIKVDLSSSKNIRAVIQQPIANGYIFKSDNAQVLQRIFHRLMTPYFTMTLWTQLSDLTYEQQLHTTEMVALSTLEVNANVPVVLKAVLQPIVLTDPSFEQEIRNKYTELKDLHTVDDLDLQTQIDAIIASGGGGGTGTVISYVYDSKIDGNGAALSHTFTHNLNTFVIQTTVFVEQSDGSYIEEYMLIRNIDANNMEIVLSYPANIKALLLLP